MAKLEHAIEERARYQILTSHMIIEHMFVFIRNFFSRNLKSEQAENQSLDNQSKETFLIYSEKRNLTSSFTGIWGASNFSAQKKPELMDVIEESRAKIQSKTKNATYTFSRTITYTLYVYNRLIRIYVYV